MKEAIQFEAWSFLEEHFNSVESERQQWIKAKVKADCKAEEVKTSRKARLRQTKLFQLSQDYPAFNEDALQSFKMSGVISK